MNAYDIKKPLYSLHKFNEAERAKKLCLEGKDKNIAVISDAGMPGISDPGEIIAKELRKCGVPYTVVPGACAAVSALVLSAFPSKKFCFFGFLPDKKADRQKYIEDYKDADATLIFYSAPQDLDRDISFLYEQLGERRACAVREITKIHEECQYFFLSEGLQGEKKGEYVLVIEGQKDKANTLCSLSEKEHIMYYIQKGMDKKEAVKAAARDRGVTKSELYKFSLGL